MEMVDVDGSSPLTAQVGWLDMRVGATRHSLCIYQMKWVNSCNGFGHDDVTTNITVCYYYYY